MSIKKRYSGTLFGFVLWFLLAVVFLTVTGCDEGMNMVPPVVTEPTEPVEPTDPATEPTTNGEVKQPEEPVGSEVTVMIGTAVQNDDGSITVSGVSANLPEGTTVAVTFGDGVTRANGRTDANGRWTTMLSVAEASVLSTGTVAITATATGAAPDTGSVGYTTPKRSVTISMAAQNDDGSVTVSGVSASLPKRTTVVVTLGDIVTAAATTNGVGAWVATVPAAQTEALTAGMVSVVATATGAVPGTASFEYAVRTRYGIPTPTEAERIKIDIVVEVFGYDITNEKELAWLKERYDSIVSQYDLSSFDVETEAGEEVFRRVVEYDHRKKGLAENPPPSFEENLKMLYGYYEEAFGISRAFAFGLLKIYIEETKEEYLLGGWMIDDVGIAWLIVKQANPDATDEEMLEHFRQASRERVFTISG